VSSTEADGFSQSHNEACGDREQEEFFDGSVFVEEV
jgi:hypothetical protein